MGKSQIAPHNPPVGHIQEIEDPTQYLTKSNDMPVRYFGDDAL
jgi:hypothetical protein